MRISAQVAMGLCAVFALVCFGFAFSGFSALQTEMDVAKRELSLGYAWFWAFLGSVAAIFGWLSWLIKEGKFGPAE